MGVSIPGADLRLDLEHGDEIRTELSCKYTRTSVEARLPGTGLRVEHLAFAEAGIGLRRHAQVLAHERAGVGQSQGLDGRHR